jgi:hypothetical protein
MNSHLINGSNNIQLFRTNVQSWDDKSKLLIDNCVNPLRPALVHIIIRNSASVMFIIGAELKFNQYGLQIGFADFL